MSRDLGLLKSGRTRGLRYRLSRISLALRAHIMGSYVCSKVRDSDYIRASLRTSMSPVERYSLYAAKRLYVDQVLAVPSVDGGLLA